MIEYADHVIGSQARAHELLVLDQVIQNVTPATIEFSLLLEMAKSMRRPNTPAEH